MHNALFICHNVQVSVVVVVVYIRQRQKHRQKEKKTEKETKVIQICKPPFLFTTMFRWGKWDWLDNNVLFMTFDLPTKTYLSPVNQN